MGTSSRHPSTALVSFSGIDGAGKSTQIDALRVSLQQLGQRVRVITFWDDAACLTSMRETAGHTIFRGDKGVGSPERPIHRRDKNVQSVWMTLVRLGLYLLDAFSLRLAIARVGASDVDCIICDRYMWDELANLPLRNRLTRIYVRLVAKVVPRPDISFFLDADPVQARTRKPEYPLDFLYRSREGYLTLSELVGGITVIPPGPIPEVTEQILSQVPYGADREFKRREAKKELGGGAAA
jgi:thymidylate kinase